MRNGNIRSFFENSKVDSLFLSSAMAGGEANFFYLSGMKLDNSVLAARRDGEHALLVNRINEAEAKRNSRFRVLVWKDRTDFWGKIRESVRGCRSVGLDAEFLSAKTYGDIRKRLSGKRLTDVSEILLEMRAKKSDCEIKLIRESARIARKIIEGVEIRRGKTEIGVSKELKIAAIEQGVELSFEPIVLSGPNTAMPHGKASEKKFGADEVVLIDFGVKHRGYCSDISRCFFTGKCREEKENYEQLQEVFGALLKGMRECMKCSAVQKTCDELMKGSGFGSMIHAPGHGIGLDVHESPSLSKKSKEKLKNSMTMAVEPAFYKKYGLRYEDDVVMDRGRARVI